MDKELKQQLKKIRRDLNDVKSDVGSNKDSIQEIQSDLKSVKSDVASNKENIGEMQGDLKAAKEERADLKSDVAVNKTNIQEGFEKAEKERADLRKRIDKTYNSVDGFTKVVTKLEDKFTALKEDVNRIKKTVKEELGVDLF